MPDLDPFVATAVAAADAARAVTTRHFRAALDVASKSDRSPVTVADFEAERCIKDIILGRHPRHSFIGEETGETGGETGGAHTGAGDNGDNGDEWRWVVDPIDGTKSFATGNPTFGTLIALLHRGRPVIGIIDHPALDERWLGVAGRTATHNGAPCATADAARLADASLYATSLDIFAGPALAAFNRLAAACKFRVFGGDCYCYGLLARGFTDLVCEASLNAHDYMALIPVVEGAGGVITDWQGAPLTLHSSGGVLAAANLDLHQAALAELNR